MRTQAAVNKKALVIGAGIGGLSAAIALQREGWQVEVAEQAPELRGEGAGIVLAANAIKALRKLGLTDKVQLLGAPVGKAEIRTWDGKPLTEVPTSKQAKLYGTPSYLIHREALHSLLYRQLAPTTSVQFNKKLIGWEQDDNQVTAFFEDGSQATGDVLIGADGIHSSVREQILGNTLLRYSGYTAIRGISLFNDERYDGHIGGGFEAWGPGKRFGYSNLGQGRIFWFGAINSPAGSHLPKGERKQAALHHFQGWYDPIEAVITAAEEASILAHDIYDGKPATSWSKGRVTLLGDAAHPMMPNLGQGGAQAMEDAVVLGQCLSTSAHPNIETALIAYERLRIPRTTKVVRQSRMMGSMVQLENPVAISIRNLLLRNMPADMQMKRLHWLLGHEV
ncbi:FAD-dependent urate hydroxylase [compost metagenome]